MGSHGRSRAVLGSLEKSWEVLGNPGQSLTAAVLGSPRNSWAGLGSPEQSWEVLSSPGKSWELLAGNYGNSLVVPGGPGWSWAVLADLECGDDGGTCLMEDVETASIKKRCLCPLGKTGERCVFGKITTYSYRLA
jgi:hypothetical protein